MSVWGQRLTRAIESGVAIDLTKNGGSVDPAEADQWPAWRTLSAAELRVALLNPDLRPDPHGLTVIGARITEEIDLEDASLSYPIAFMGCSFVEIPNLSEATLPRLTLTGSRLPGLQADAMRVTHVVDLSQATSTGEVRALGAQIGGQLNLNGATLTKPDRNTLNLDRATITGSLFAREKFTSQGEIRAVGAQISGQLNLGGLCTHVTLQESAVTSTLGLTAGFRGTLDIMSAHVRALLLPTDCEGRSITWAGVQLQSVDGGLDNRAAAARWLETDPQGFRAQPWHQVADCYGRDGRPEDATWLRIKAAHHTREHASRHRKVWLWLYWLFAGYGYRPLYAAGWLVAATLAACLLAFFNQWAFSPADNLTAQLQASGQLSFNPWTYGLGTVIPPATTLTDRWNPTAPWVTAAITALKTFGWIQTAILLAGLTGLLRKT